MRWNKSNCTLAAAGDSVYHSRGLIRLLDCMVLLRARSLRIQLLMQFLLWGGEEKCVCVSWAPGQTHVRQAGGKLHVLSISFSKKEATGVERWSWYHNNWRDKALKRSSKTGHRVPLSSSLLPHSSWHKPGAEGECRRGADRTSLHWVRVSVLTVFTDVKS